MFLSFISIIVDKNVLLLQKVRKFSVRFHYGNIKVLKYSVYYNNQFLFLNNFSVIQLFSMSNYIYLKQ